MLMQLIRKIECESQASHDMQFDLNNDHYKQMEDFQIILTAKKCYFDSQLVV